MKKEAIGLGIFLLIIGLIMILFWWPLIDFETKDTIEDARENANEGDTIKYIGKVTAKYESNHYLLYSDGRREYYYNIAIDNGEFSYELSPEESKNININDTVLVTTKVDAEGNLEVHNVEKVPTLLGAVGAFTFGPGIVLIVIGAIFSPMLDNRREGKKKRIAAFQLKSDVGTDLTKIHTDISELESFGFDVSQLGTSLEGLQSRLDNLQFGMTIKSKDLQLVTKKLDTIKDETLKFKRQVDKDLVNMEKFQGWLSTSCNLTSFNKIDKSLYSDLLSLYNEWKKIICDHSIQNRMLDLNRKKEKTLNLIAGYDKLTEHETTATKEAKEKIKSLKEDVRSLEDEIETLLELETERQHNIVEIDDRAKSIILNIDYPEKATIPPREKDSKTRESKTYIKVADETWIGTALLHYENPKRESFTVREIVDRVAKENINGELRPGIQVHANLHCVANKAPNPGKYRMLYETEKGRRRLYREGDDYHKHRESGKIKPLPKDIPKDYLHLLRWYNEVYNKIEAKGEGVKIISISEEEKEDFSQKPTQKTATKPVGSFSEVSSKSGINYERAHIIYKIRIENNTSEPIGEIYIKPIISKEIFIIDKEERMIPLLKTGEAKTVSFKLRPKHECGNVDISGNIRYFEYKTEDYKDLKIEPKRTTIICPMMKVIKIDEKDWWDITSRLIKVEETTEDIPIKGKVLFDLVKDVLRDQNLYMLEPKITKDENIFRGVVRFYCEGVKGLKYGIYVEVIGGSIRSKLILKAYAENEESLIGFYHCILDEIQKRTNVKKYVSEAVIVQGDYVVGDKKEIKDSVIHRSNV